MNSLKVFEVNLWGVWPVPGLVEYFAKYAINENLEEDTFVYEFKTGPYKGQKFDKEFLNET